MPCNRPLNKVGSKGSGIEAFWNFDPKQRGKQQMVDILFFQTSRRFFAKKS